MKHFLSDSNDLYNNSFFLKKSKQKKNESDDEKNFSELNSENLSVSSNNENKTIDDNITILSIPSEKEEELNKDKIPKTKEFNCIHQYIDDKYKSDKKEIFKKVDNKKITNIIFSKYNINSGRQKFAITRLNKDFLNHSKNTLANKYYLSNNSLDNNKKPLSKTLNNVGKNLNKFIKLNKLNKTNKLINKYSTKKTEKMKEKINKNKLYVKMKLKNLSINSKQCLTSNAQILNKLKTNSNKIKSNINNNNLTTFINIKKRKEKIKSEINKSLFKKRAINITKSLKKKLNVFIPINHVKKIQNNNFPNINKRYTNNFTNKNSKIKIIKKDNQVNNYLTTHNSKFSFINEYFQNISNNLKKIKESYFSLNKKTRTINKKDKRKCFLIIPNTQKFLNVLKKNEIINKSTNFSFKENEILKVKRNNKNKNNLANVNKIMNTSSNYKKYTKFINTININNNRISTPNSFRKAYKTNLIFNGNNIYNFFKN